MVKIGDKVVVINLPSRDINGYAYDIVGGGGIVLEVKENSTIIRLFDGYTIEAEGNDFDVYGK